VFLTRGIAEKRGKKESRGLKKRSDSGKRHGLVLANATRGRRRVLPLVEKI